MEEFIFYFVIVLLFTLPVSFFIYFLLTKLKKSWAPYERKFVSTILGITFTPLVLFGAFYTWTYIQDYHPKNDFNQVAWQNQPSERYLMVDDLIKEKTMIGLKTNQVKDIFGEPQYTTDSTMHYPTGTRSGAFFFIICSVEIFLENQKVTKVEKIEHAD